jgi:tetratricopeptide (TPR) repeat protein
MPKTEEFALKALELDSTLAEAHSLLGDAKRHYYDWPGAEKEYKLAMELDPGASEVPYGYALLMTEMGRHDEAIALNRRAQQLDPLNPATRTVAAVHFRIARRYDEAIEQCQAALDMNPNFQRAYEYLARVYENMGQYEKAAAARQQQWILGGASEKEVAGISNAAAAGAEAYWQWQLDRYKERLERGEYVPPVFLASGFAQLGEKDQAFQWLENAYEERVLGGTAKEDPYWDPLRDDPRFQDLLRRMNLEP